MLIGVKPVPELLNEICTENYCVRLSQYQACFCGDGFAAMAKCVNETRTGSHTCPLSEEIDDGEIRVLFLSARQINIRTQFGIQAASISSPAAGLRVSPAAERSWQPGSGPGISVRKDLLSEGVLISILRLVSGRGLCWLVPFS